MSIRFKADGTRVDDDEELRNGEWVVVNPMIKDTFTAPAQDAVAVDDSRQRYIDRLTRRTTTQDAQSSAAEDEGVDDAYQGYLNRLTRGKSKGTSGVNDSASNPPEWMR